MSAVTCMGCGRPILDRYVLEAVPGLLRWHTACLRCSQCGQLIDEKTGTCYLRHCNIYCVNDFRTLFSGKQISDKFTSSTDDFGAAVSSRLRSITTASSIAELQLCIDVHVPLTIPFAGRLAETDVVTFRMHSMPPTCGLEVANEGETSSVGRYSSDSSVPAYFSTSTTCTDVSEAGTGRVRTILSEYQLHVLRTCYAVSPRPDLATRNQLTDMTGLSARVIRVWFQNKRCKDKKRSSSKHRHHLHHHSPTLDTQLSD